MGKSETIKTETEGLLNKMINQFEVEVAEEEGVFHIIIKTEEASTVIGRHGETIRAIQKILEVMLYKQFSEPVDLLVNVNDYREKQTEKLTEMAESAAKKARDEKVEVSLPSLSAYERKVIHELITKNHPDLSSYSVGEGRDRQLIIGPKKEETK